MFEYITRDEMKAVVADPAEGWTRNPSETVNKKHFANPEPHFPPDTRPVQAMVSEGETIEFALVIHSWNAEAWFWWDSRDPIPGYTHILAWRPCPYNLKPDDYGEVDEDELC